MATSSSISRSIPQRGEIWLVNFDPTVGAEIQKKRPAVVVSSNTVGKLPLRLIAPVTGWDVRFEGNVWHVKITPLPTNGLTKVSAVDVLQLRGCDVLRFINKMGVVSPALMEEITAAIAAVVEYE